LTEDLASPYSGRLNQALYATFAFPIYIMGLTMFVVPALAGKA